VLKQTCAYFRYNTVRGISLGVDDWEHKETFTDEDEAVDIDSE
jgi:hypothetical protein